MVRIPQRYVPKFLTRKDKRKQKKQLLKSRQNYKRGKYYTRKKKYLLLSLKLHHTYLKPVKCIK